MDGVGRLSAAPAVRWGAAAGLAVLVLLAPGISEGCSFCAYGRGDANTAYLLTAAAMGTLPIGFGVGLALWLRKKTRAAARGAADGDASTTTTE